ncbi:unnamed protein product, partial [Choristocarpus tenellus]
SILRPLILPTSGTILEVFTHDTARRSFEQMNSLQDEQGETDHHIVPPESDVGVPKEKALLLDVGPRNPIVIAISQGYQAAEGEASSVLLALSQGGLPSPRPEQVASSIGGEGEQQITTPIQSLGVRLDDRIFSYKKEP